MIAEGDAEKDGEEEGTNTLGVDGIYDVEEVEEGYDTEAEDVEPGVR